MSRSDIDGGWAWVILFTSFCGMLLNGSMIYSAGVVMAAMLDEIDSDLSRISWVIAIFAASMCTSGPVIGVVINKFGCRVSAIVGSLLSLIGLTGAHFTTDVYQLIPTYAILTGIGLGFIMCTSIVVSGYYFKKFRPIASGITVSGAGCGMFIGPPVFRLLIDAYTLKGAFLIIGGISANFCVCGMLMRPSPTERDNFKKTKASPRSAGIYVDANQNRFRFLSELRSVKSNIEKYMRIFRNVPFLSYLLSIFAWTAGETAAILHLPNYTEQQGTSKMAAATLMTAMGVTSLISRLLTGFAASDPRIGPEILHVGLLGIIGMLTMTFPLFSYSFETQILYTAAYGLYSGGINTLVNPLAAELVSLENLASGFGVLAFTSGIGSLAGTPIAGMIVDNGGAYTHSYVYAGAMLLLASFIATPVALRRKDTSTDNPGDAVEISVDVPAELEPLKSTESVMNCNDKICQNDDNHLHNKIDK